MRQPETMARGWKAGRSILLALALTLCFGGVALATPGGERPGSQRTGAQRTGAPSLAEAPVQLTVTIIEASRTGAGVDPSLARLARYFERSFKDFKRFTGLGVHERTVKLDGAASVALPGGLELTLTHLGTDKGFVRLAMTLDGLKTTIKVKDGGLFFQAGRKHGDGILVLAIEAATRP